MIGHLQGTLLEIAPDRVLLDVSGVGYEVHIPLSTYYEVEKLGQGAEAALRVYTHVREDALLLFGFRSLSERQIFERLLAVSGIGPRLALAVLALPVEVLVAALRAGDVKALSRVPGIGKKTAERMLIELRDKVDDFATSPEAAGTGAPSAPVDDDLIQALVGLGYKARTATDAVAKTVEENPDAPTPELLRLSLKRLSRL